MLSLRNCITHNVYYLKCYHTHTHSATPSRTKDASQISKFFGGLPWRIFEAIKKLQHSARKMPPTITTTTRREKIVFYYDDICWFFLSLSLTLHSLSDSSLLYFIYFARRRRGNASLTAEERLRVKARVVSKLCVHIHIRQLMKHAQGVSCKFLRLPQSSSQSQTGTFCMYT